MCAHLCYETMRCGIFVWCIVGSVGWVYLKTSQTTHIKVIVLKTRSNLGYPDTLLRHTSHPYMWICTMQSMVLTEKEFEVRVRDGGSEQIQGQVKLHTSTHWGRVTHMCVSKVTIIVSDSGLSPGRRKAIIWNNDEILWIGPLGTNFSGILIESHTFSFKKMHLKMSSGKWRPFCLVLDVLRYFS